MRNYNKQTFEELRQRAIQRRESQLETVNQVNDTLDKIHNRGQRKVVARWIKPPSNRVKSNQAGSYAKGYAKIASSTLASIQRQTSGKRIVVKYRSRRQKLGD